MLTGKKKEAGQLLSRIIHPQKPETLKFAAEVYSDAGKYKLAEKYQDLYLKTSPAQVPQAYGFLGDIRLSRGDKVNARRAYQKGLDALLDQTSRAAPAPPSQAGKF